MDWHEKIHESGFAILPDIFSAPDLDQFLHRLDVLPQSRSRAGVRHALEIPAVEALATTPECLELARDVLGPQAFPFRATLFDKSQTANWLVVWHQDTALPLQSRRDCAGWGPWSVKAGIDYAHAPASALTQVLALRVSLDDSTVENGPLRVLPRTHTLGVLTDDEAHELSTQIAPTECLSAKGGVVAMRPLIVHASSKSRAAMPRRVLHIEYAASEFIAEPLRLAIA